MSLRLAGLISVIMMLHSVASIADSQWQVSLAEDRFEHISFGKIPACHYHFEQNHLRIEVDGCASFVMQSFERVRRVKAVQYEWRSHGELKVRDAIHERHRDGDDALFKLGLLLKADFELPNPFAPKWLKRVESLLRFPSESMLNLTAGSRHRAGERWSGPYNSRVTMIAMPAEALTDGWQRASYRFEQPVEVVAVWLMADGDNTGSRFTTWVRKPVFELAD